MSTNGLFRIAGWCALAAALSMIAAIVSFIIAPTIGAVIEMFFLLMLAIVFYALYVAHRSASAGLSLAALALGIAALGVDVGSMANYGNTFLSSLWYTVLSLPLMIFGVLGYRAARTPRVLSLVILVAGILFLISGVGGFFAGADFSDNVSLIPFLMLTVSLVWLWRVFLAMKPDTA